MGFDIPSWIGTPPQWGLFIIGFITFFRYVVIPWRQQNITVDESTITRLGEEVKSLRERLETCEGKCDERDQKILGLERKLVTQQISFARILMDKLGRDDP